MKNFCSVFLLACFLISLCGSAAVRDSLPPKKIFVEVKAGAILFLKGSGFFTPQINDQTRSLISETFNIGFGRVIRNFSIGINFDYTRYRITGNTKTVGYSIYKSPAFIPYQIRQEFSYFNLSIGVSATYLIKLKRWGIELGPSVYFVGYRSIITGNNIYVGPQGVYPHLPLPPANQFNNKQLGWTRDNIPYFGLNLNLNYRVNSWFSLKLFNALFYDFDVKISGNTYMDGSTLPKQNIYTIDKQIWLNSGLAARFTF